MSAASLWPLSPRFNQPSLCMTHYLADSVVKGFVSNVKRTEVMPQNQPVSHIPTGCSADITTKRGKISITIQGLWNEPIDSISMPLPPTMSWMRCHKIVNTTLNGCNLCSVSVCQIVEEDKKKKKKIQFALGTTAGDNKAQPKEWNKLMILALNPSFLARKNEVTSRHAQTEGVSEK